MDNKKYLAVCYHNEDREVSYWHDTFGEAWMIANSMKQDEDDYCDVHCAENEKEQNEIKEMFLCETQM